MLSGAIWQPFLHLSANLLQVRYASSETVASREASVLLAGAVILYPVVRLQIPTIVIHVHCLGRLPDGSIQSLHAPDDLHPPPHRCHPHLSRILVSDPTALLDRLAMVSYDPLFRRTRHRYSPPGHPRR